MGTWKELCERHESIDKNRSGSTYYITTEEFDRIRTVVDAAKLVAEHASEPDIAGRMVIKSGRVANMEQALKDLGVTE